MPRFVCLTEISSISPLVSLIIDASDKSTVISPDPEKTGSGAYPFASAAMQRFSVAHPKLISFRSCPDKRLKNKKSCKAFALQDSLRKDRDSNPGNLSVQRFSRPPQSTTLPSFQYVLRSNVSFNCFAKVVILLEYTRVLCAFFLFVYSFLLRIECVGIPFLLLFL